MNTSRRDFLKTISTGTSLSLLSLISPINARFTEKLDEKFATKNSLSSKDYSLSDNVRYLNHGSIGTIPKIVQEAHQEYLTMCETNPWFYMWSGEWDKPIQEVRSKVASYINADIDEISFPHNTTEVYNLLALGLDLKKGDEVLFCNLNHAGASIPFHIHSKKRGYSVKVFDIPTDNIASITTQNVVDLYDANITDKTKLIVMPHIDNTFGLRHPVKEISKLARSKGVEFISIDTAQTMGMIPIDVKDLDIDVIGTSAHKWIQAPKGVSLAYFSKRIQDHIDPISVTWGQSQWQDSARKFEDYGTRNLPEVLTLGHALDFQQRIDPLAREKKLKELWKHAKSLTSKNPLTEWRSPEEWELGGSLFVIELKNHAPSEFAKKAFTNYGVVFRAFDNHSTIRISPNTFNTKEELNQLFSLIV
ncbi:MAG: aminotransferase class V-fold PLP-dependent enzyme [Balneola sp.]